MRYTKLLYNSAPITLFLHVLLFCCSTVAQLLERITVLENSPLNTVILDLRSALVRHGEGQLPPNATAYASQQESFWPFVLEDFVIKLGRPLDREAVCQRQNTELRTDHLSTSNKLSSYGQPTHECLSGACCQLLHVNILPSPTALPKAFYIQVAVQDVNDNTPQFPPIHSPYTVIREDIGVDERIWLPQALDPDSPQFSVVDYRLESWTHGNASHFQLGIAEENGMITSGLGDSALDFPPLLLQGRESSVGRPFLRPTGPLDREVYDVYAFTLLAIDGGNQMRSNKFMENQARTGSVNVLIKIADINDNKPIFDNTMYEVKIVENVMASTVMEFEVIDRDIGENGRIAVTIHDPGGHAQRLFRVGLHPTTKSSTHSAIPDSNLSKGSFYKGFLQLVSHVDAERHPATLRFALVATDFGQPSLSSRANVQVHIVNVNDNAPQIAFFSRGRRLTDNRMSLPELDTPPLSLVVLVHVTDVDSPVSQIRCRIIHESDTFSLEEATGSGYPNYRSESLFERALDSRGIVSSYRQFALRTKTELDRETKSHFVVTVACDDEEGDHSLSRNASLHITITDANDHSPMFDRKVYSGRVAENIASAEVYLSSPMRVTDKDLGANALLTFSLLDVQNGTDLVDDSRNESLYFRTDSRSGRIWTIMPLDCETRSQYSLMLIVRDSGTPVQHSSSALIHVTVEDANDNAPEFTSVHYLFEIAENSPGGTEIGKVEAVDHDTSEANRKLHYGLRGRPEDLHLISIDRTTGILRTRRPIDRESRSSISLLVTAENEVPIRMVSNPESGSSNLQSSMSHRLSAEASLVVTILNVNDNRPEFTLIEPHRSHITFIWEQLGVVTHPNHTELNRSQTEKLNQKKDDESKPSSSGNNLNSDFIQSRKVFTQNPGPVCERLPHRVTDKDISPDNNFECCILELLDDFDGLFALMPEAPNVLCAMRRPPRPKSYKLTLIAKDGVTNDSLSSQVHFTVVIRSDPTLRHGDPRANVGGIPPPHGSNSHMGGRSDVLDSAPGQRGDWSTGLYSAGQQLTDRSQLTQTGRSRLTGSHTLNGPTHQTVIIIVMASVAGILCVLLLLAIVLTKRCLLDSKTEYAKSDPENATDGNAGLKSSGSVHSTPSKTQSCNIAPMTVQRLPLHPEYYSKEFIYHHPRINDGGSYELTTRTLAERHGLISPTIPRNAMRMNPTSSVVIGPSTMLATNQFRDSPSPNTMLEAVIPSTGKDIYGHPCNSNWPPIPFCARKPHSSHQGKAIVNTSTNILGNNNQKLDSTYTQGVYQTIDSGLVPGMHTPCRVRTSGRTNRIEHASEQMDLDESVTTLLGKSNISYTDLPYATGQDAKPVGGKNTQDYMSVTKKREVGKLLRTNSERSGYFQTSFV